MFLPKVYTITHIHPLCICRTINCRKLPQLASINTSYLHRPTNLYPAYLKHTTTLYVLISPFSFHLMSKQFGYQMLEKGQRFIWCLSRAYLLSIKETMKQFMVMEGNWYTIHMHLCFAPHAYVTFPPSEKNSHLAQGVFVRRRTLDRVSLHLFTVYTLIWQPACLLCASLGWTS